MGDKPKVIDAASGTTGYTRSRRSSVIAALRSRAEKEHRRSKPGTGNGAGTRYVYTILLCTVYSVCMYILYVHTYVDTAVDVPVLLLLLLVIIAVAIRVHTVFM
jgi:hypothetical protein